MRFLASCRMGTEIRLTKGWKKRKIRPDTSFFGGSMESPQEARDRVVRRLVRCGVLKVLGEESMEDFLASVPLPPIDQLQEGDLLMLEPRGIEAAALCRISQGRLSEEDGEGADWVSYDERHAPPVAHRWIAARFDLDTKEFTPRQNVERFLVADRLGMTVAQFVWLTMQYRDPRMVPKRDIVLPGSRLRQYTGRCAYHVDFLRVIQVWWYDIEGDAVEGGGLICGSVRVL